MLWFQKGNTSQTHQRCQLFWTASPRAPLLSVPMKAPSPPPGSSVTSLLLCSRHQRSGPLVTSHRTL